MCPIPTIPHSAPSFDVDPTSDFPIQNLPYGVFSAKDGLAPRVGVAIGDYVLDLWELEQDWTARCRCARCVLRRRRSIRSWRWGRRSGRRPARGSASCCATTSRNCATIAELRRRALVPMADVKLHLPIAVAGYTDFYSSKEHATNVGVMFRGKDNALQPNWLHMPIGYNGRASTVVVSGTTVRRPRGQLKPPTVELPSFGPCKRLDFELEMGVVIGQSSAIGEMLSEQQAEADDLRLRDPERLERARYPAVGICAARAVPGQGVRHLDQPVDRDARGAGAVPDAWAGAGSGAAAVSAGRRSRTITISSSRWPCARRR